MSGWRQALTAVRVTLLAWVVCGLVFPLAVVALGGALFPYQAGGSLIRGASGSVVGSAHIGQYFSSPRWFWGRPSATVNPATGHPEPYAANNSSGSNLGPTNPALEQEVRANLRIVLAADPGLRAGEVPLDLVESSGSGLDPDITPAAALVQVPRVATATGFLPARLQALVRTQEHTGFFLRLFGSPHVNVLQLNLALLRLERRR